MTTRATRTRARPAAPVRWAAVAVAATLLLAGCGDAEEPAAVDASESVEEQPSESAAPSPSEVSPSEEAVEGPACEDVWVAGEQLPRRYSGCERDDRWVKAFVYPCSSGQKLVTFGRTFYAAKGRAINEVENTLDRDPVFQQALAACSA